ncbi:thermonuclease family protein [Novosphingobium flavum]|uniref:Thermonuclease family protein n=1 Tax=Novosphingobium flavum TaxID=1778672 RepID=A0A7X1KK92_9SPHN|nr:thermonuclease family protein [Novosphingobium flavum]MBC2664304.1 thermonuclease family protein [Novosphingobium flavum]
MTAFRNIHVALGSVLITGLAAPTLAETIAGPATVIDGDSLVVAGQQVRLVGIDAPEFDQTCQRGGQSWTCGQEAKTQLTSLVQDQRIECSGFERDAHARLLAVCSAGYLELNKTLVENGWAVAYRAYSDAYVGQEARAKAGRLGIWASEFTPPADYRMAKLPPAAAMGSQRRVQPGRAEGFSGCTIKGNHSRRGDWIYHLPGMKYYNVTRAEAMFCTEQEAQRAGYRRSRSD